MHVTHTHTHRERERARLFGSIKNADTLTKFKIHTVGYGLIPINYI